MHLAGPKFSLGYKFLAYYTTTPQPRVAALSSISPCSPWTGASFRFHLGSSWGFEPTMGKSCVYPDKEQRRDSRPLRLRPTGWSKVQCPVMEVQEQGNSQVLHSGIPQDWGLCTKSRDRRISRDSRKPILATGNRINPGILTRIKFQVQLWNLRQKNFISFLALPYSLITQSP